MSPPSRVDTKYKTGGETGICSGMTALSKLTSACDTSNGWGRMSQTLHQNNLLPISPNLEQAKCENLVEGVGPIDGSTPVPQADKALPVD